MATVNYYLKGALSDRNIQDLGKSEDGNKYLKEYEIKPLQIVLKVSSGGKRIQAYTKRRIAPKYWDKSKQRYNPARYRLNCSDNNNWLNDLQYEVEKLTDDLERQGRRITQDDLRRIIDRKSQNKPTSKSLKEVFEMFLQEHTTSEGNPLKQLTIKKYEGFFNHLAKFSRKKNQTFDIYLFNSDLLFNFKKYLQTDVGHSDYTVRKYILTARVFMKYLSKKQIIEKLDFSELKVTARSGEIYIVPLDKVVEMQQAEIEDQRLAQVRDVFCFICWTGQRYSDIERITWEDIIEGNNDKRYWDLTTTKTSTRIQVPIIDYAEKILAKYEGNEYPLPRYTNQNMNRNLKDLGKEYEWNWKVKKLAYYNGIPKEEYVQFYEVLTTHVGRKSFITNSLMLGLDERTVREISGHKDEKSFRRYVKLAEDFVAQKMHNAFSSENVKRFLSTHKDTE